MQNFEKKRFLNVKFLFAFVTATTWLLFSVWIAKDWTLEVAEKTSFWFMFFTLSGIAFIPGFIIFFLYSSMFLDKRNKYDLNEAIDTSVLIAAFNEENNILKPLEAIEKQSFNGKLEIIIIDDGSSDKTSELVLKFMSLPRKFVYRLITMPENNGKSSVLNKGLEESLFDTIVTMDADTTLATEDALQRLVSSLNGRYKSVAGAVVSRNPNKNWITKFQEWDYLFGISIVKRIQSMYSGTLVCQGAFSAYKKETLLEVGGWKPVVGEDIVLTWDMLNKGYETYHNADAIALTETPETYKQFFHQRKRWSRGMIEAFRSNWELLFKARLSTVFVWYNFLFPYIDFIFAFIFIPSVFGALFFNFYLMASKKTLLIIPLSLFFTALLYLVQKKTFNKMGLKMSKNFIGMFCYILFFQIVQTPATLAGYFSEIFKLKKNWGTKKSKNLTMLAILLISSSSLFGQVKKIETGSSSILDTDKNSASKVWFGYYNGSNSLHYFGKAGEIFVSSDGLSQSMSFVSMGIQSKFNDYSSLDLLFEQIFDDWSPILYDLNFKLDPTKKFHLELLSSRTFVETSLAIRERVSLFSNGLTLDYQIVDEKLIVVTGYINQQFTDKNDRNVYIGKIVWVVKDLFSLNATARLLRAKDFSENYFSPNLFDTYSIGASKYVPIKNNSFIKPEFGFGSQKVASEEKGFYYAKLLLHGDLGKNFFLEVSTMHSTARSENGAYGLFMGDLKISYKF